MTIHNSHILYNKSHANNQLTHKEFRTQLAIELMDQWEGYHQPRVARSDAIQHKLFDFEKELECKHCSRKNGEKRTRTKFGCQGCDVHLCPRQCFFKWHHRH